MFESFPRRWTPVELSSRVRRGRTLRTRVAGEWVALFRARSGALGALLDRCPHRGASLSLGRVTEDGTLECPFHGWRFTADGRCAHVPFNDPSPAQRARLGTVALPVREIGGLVWLFTGEHADGTEPAAPEALREPGWALFRHAEEWSTHWTRAMENMLDFPHLPYVHRRSIGRRLRGPAARGAPLTLTTRETEHGMTIESIVDGASSGASLEWRRPNGMVLTLDAGSRRLRQHVYCVPVDGRTTRMILVSARDFGLWNPLMALFDRANLWILHEDRAVVESSDPPEVPRPASEKSVATDGPTLAFRRWYFRELRTTPAAAPVRRARHLAVVS